MEERFTRGYLGDGGRHSLADVTSLSTTTLWMSHFSQGRPTHPHRVPFFGARMLYPYPRSLSTAF